MAISNGSLTDVEGNGLTSQTNGTQQALDVGVNVAGIQVDPRDTRALTPATDSVNVQDITGTVSLPTGAATSAKQDTGNTSLSSIDSKLNTLGQKTSAASAPVVIASDQPAISVTTQVAHGSLTDRSGTVSQASTSIIPANPNRKYLMIENVGSAKLWINFTSAANQSQPSILLSPNGGSFTMEGNFVTTEQVFAIASANNSPFTAKEA